ncbi:MAG: glycosyltransferase family 4 protein [Tagaea sp.]|nr:glycosyltransferase family 4 protein [Tagaea sp.]
MAKPKNILFVHQNFPGQYLRLAPALAARGHKTLALAIERDGEAAGTRVLRYVPKRGTTPDAHPWAQDFETKILRGEACARAVLDLKRKGFVPDTICANPGWGESLFLKDALPQAKLHLYLEFFYRAEGGDYGFDPEFPAPEFDGAARLRARSAAQLLALDSMDGAVAPTAWQRGTFPEPYRKRIDVCFDGVDVARIVPDPNAVLEIGGNRFAAGEKIVTFVNRNLEPYRGYHIFMRALPRLLARVPDARILLVGGDGVSYGAKPKDGISYKERFLAEVKDRIDPARVHFLGKLPYETYLKALQVSAAHVYLTYPFALSWSLFEAMSAGCTVIASSTGPVLDLVEHGKTGVLVDFFDKDGLADAIAGALEKPEAHRKMRIAARAHVKAKYALDDCLARHVKLVERY